MTPSTCKPPHDNFAVQVSFERTIGTIAGGTLGYVTILVGHRLLEASDALVAGMPHHVSVCVYVYVYTTLCPYRFDLLSSFAGLCNHPGGAPPPGSLRRLGSRHAPLMYTWKHPDLYSGWQAQVRPWGLSTGTFAATTNADTAPIDNTCGSWFPDLRLARGC